MHKHNRKAHPANKPAGVEDAVRPSNRTAGGRNGDGLRTRLVPLQKEYVLGQPAKFRLEMKNAGEQGRTYDPQQADCNSSIRVSDRDGKPVRYVAGGYQTGGHAKSIAPGETVVLFDKLDLATNICSSNPALSRSGSAGLVDGQRLKTGRVGVRFRHQALLRLRCGQERCQPPRGSRPA